MSHRSAAARGAALLALAAGLLGACSSDLAAPADPASVSPDFATSSTGATIVTEADVSRQAEDTPPLRSWVVYTRNGGSGVFQVGPGNVPEGVGSFGTTTPTSADKVQLFNFDYVGTPLADITALGYATWRTSGDAPNQVPAINLVVDYNGPDVTGGFTTLVFEPVYNTNQGTITDGAWQTWDAFAEGNAVWWSSKAIPAFATSTASSPGTRSSRTTPTRRSWGESASTREAATRRSSRRRMRSCSASGERPRPMTSSRT
jgi:hypothetical protein